MKKLSKIFAVALVLAMALSVMSIGAGALAATAGTKKGYDRNERRR